MSESTSSSPEPGKNRKNLTAREEKRLKWWHKHKKSTEGSKNKEDGTEVSSKREGLRQSTLDIQPATYSEARLMQQEIQSKGGFRTSYKVKNKPKKPTNINNKSLVQKNNHIKDVKTSQKNSTPETKVSIESAGANGPDSPSKHIPKSYVLFIGNLPYNITQEQLEDHFRKTGGVKKIRIPKKRGEEKTRGFAYIEFKDRISHNIALRLHHTTLAGRKINVEFTSIGGGKSQDRKEKLKLKNLSRAKMKMPLKDS